MEQKWSFTAASPEVLLDFWSELISKDFHNSNGEIGKAPPDLIQISSIMNQQKEVLMNISHSLSELCME